MQTNHSIKIANFITLKVKPGEEEKLAEFLAGRAKAVAAFVVQTADLKNQPFAFILTT